MNIIWIEGGTAEIHLTEDWCRQFDIDVEGPVALYDHGGEIRFGWCSTLAYNGIKKHWGGGSMLIKWETIQALGDEKLAILVTGIVWGHQATLGGSDEL